MEFDELKKAWGQFNDKINCQEVVERQQVEEMLAKKRMTSYNRLLWYERISLGILFFLFLNVFADMSDIVTNWKNRIKGRDWHIRNLQKHEVFSALNLAELFE